MPKLLFLLILIYYVTHTVKFFTRMIQETDCLAADLGAVHDNISLILLLKRPFHFIGGH